MKWILIAIILCGSWDCKAQNLIPNPSFEQYIGCPTSISQLDSTKSWYIPTTGSTDYFHTCSPQPGVKVPDVFPGFQYPKTGNAFAGIGNNFINYREYLAVKLNYSFIKDISYHITCWINLGNDSKYTVSKADIGIYFSEDSVGMPQNFDSKPLPFVPQVVAGANTEFVTDTLNWTQLTFEYEAEGGEQFMAFGIFGDDSTITSIQLQSFGMDVYFNLDDFSIIPNEYAFDLNLDTITYSSNCYSDSSAIQLRFQNTGIKALDFTIDTVTFTTEVKVNNTVVQNFDFVLDNNSSNPISNTPLAPDSFMAVEIFPLDLSRLGQVHEITLTSSFERDEDTTNNRTSTEIIPVLDVGELTVSPKIICPAEEVKLQTTDYVGEPIWQYSTNGQMWQNLPPGAYALHHPTGSTFYRVEICNFLASVSILVEVNKTSAPMGFSDTVCGSGFYTIIPAVDLTVDSYNWYSSEDSSQYFHSGLDYSSFFERTQIFYIQKVKDGCISEEKTKVELVVENCPLKIPNVFTPNGDGINDTFYFHNSNNKKLQTQVFNRWGNKVANWSGNQGWDGSDLPEGVYFYVVKEIKGSEVKVHKGKVTLLR